MFGQPTGVGQYTKRLVEALSQILSETNLTVFAFNFLTRSAPEPIFTGNTKIKYRYIRLFPGKIYTFAFKLGLTIPINLLLRSKPDIIWFPNFVRWPVWGKKVKTIITLYDLSFIKFGQYSSPANRRYMLRFVPESIDKASHIITISKNSKSEIINQYKVDPAKISIVYPAVDHEVFYPRNVAEIESIKHKYKLPKNYILYVGTIEPRKNIDGILDAYEALGENLRRNYGLVLAGGKGWLDDKIQARIASYQKTAGEVHKLGYVPDDDLPALYSGAGVFIYPSFYEGFGMPPLEALACGVPVITADNSSLPEVVGKAAILIQADDTQGLASAVGVVLEDKKKRQAMVVAGIKQAQKYNWQTSAQQLKKVMELVLDATI